MQSESCEAPVMCGPSIVGFGRYANVTANGKSADWPRMGFSPRKAALTLYLASTPQTEAMLARLGCDAGGAAARAQSAPLSGTARAAGCATSRASAPSSPSEPRVPCGREPP